MSHRPGRHAVVRRADGAYLKVVRPGRSGGVVSASEQAVVHAAGRFDVPVVLGHDPGAGVVVWAGLAGPTLLELAQARPRDAVLASAWTAAGRAVSSSTAPRSMGCPYTMRRRRPQRPSDGSRRQWRGACFPRRPQRGIREPARRAPWPPGHAPPRPPRQAGGRRPAHGTARPGHPGGRRAGPRPGQCAGPPRPAPRPGAHESRPGRRGPERVPRGAAPDPATLERIPAHVRVARLRLAGVYAFRPRWRGLARRWLDMATTAAPP